LVNPIQGLWQIILVIIGGVFRRSLGWLCWRRRILKLRKIFLLDTSLSRRKIDRIWARVSRILQRCVSWGQVTGGWSISRSGWAWNWHHTSLFGRKSRIWWSFGWRIFILTIYCWIGRSNLTTQNVAFRACRTSRSRLFTRYCTIYAHFGLICLLWFILGLFEHTCKGFRGFFNSTGRRWGSWGRLRRILLVPVEYSVLGQ